MCHELGILINAYKLNYICCIALMNANKTNVQKHVANICFSIHNAHRAQHIPVRMMKLLYSINFTFIHVFCFCFTRIHSTPWWLHGISLYWPNGCALHLSHTSACVRRSEFKEALRIFRQTALFFLLFKGKSVECVTRRCVLHLLEWLAGLNSILLASWSMLISSLARTVCSRIVFSRLLYSRSLVTSSYVSLGRQLINLWINSRGHFFFFF